MQTINKLKFSLCTRNISSTYFLSSVQTQQATLDKYNEQYQQRIAQIKAHVDQFSNSSLKKAERWNKQNDIYYGKDRDFKNFPTQVVTEYHPKVRMGFIPDYWFQSFYDKTGVTGPYLFIFGGLTFMFSKEIIVMDHEFFEVPAFIAVLVFLTKKFGKKISTFLEKMSDERYDKIFTPFIKNVSQEAEAFKSTANTLINNEASQKLLFDAKRENVLFQLESAYRNRLVKMHKDVKNRLDYQLERESVRESLQRNHMNNWIIENVRRSITPQLEKATLAQCIKDLQGLSVQAAK